MADYNNRTNFNSRAGNTQQESTNTNGIMLKNHKFHKFLACSYWNRTAVIEIGSIPEGADNDFTVLRNVQTIKQVMTFNTITTLDEILEEAIHSIKTTGQLSPAGAPAGSTFSNLVEITDGSNLDPGLNLPKGVYLVIYKDWDNARATQKFDVYPFSTRTILRGYDHNTGRCTEDIDKLRDLKDFYLFIHETCKAMTNAQAHAIMEVSRKERSNSLKAMSLIANALGIDIGTSVPMKSASTKPNNSGKSGGYQNKSFNKGGYSNNSGGGYKNGYTGYRGGSTGGFPNRGNQQSQRDTTFSPDDGMNLELNLGSVNEIPIDQFV